MAFAKCCIENAAKRVCIQILTFPTLVWHINHRHSSLSLSNQTHILSLDFIKVSLCSQWQYQDLATAPDKSKACGACMHRMVFQESDYLLHSGQRAQSLPLLPLRQQLRRNHVQLLQRLVKLRKRLLLSQGAKSSRKMQTLMLMLMLTTIPPRQAGKQNKQLRLLNKLRSRLRGKLHQKHTRPSPQESLISRRTFIQTMRQSLLSRSQRVRGQRKKVQCMRKQLRLLERRLCPLDRSLQKLKQEAQQGKSKMTISQTAVRTQKCLLMVPSFLTDGRRLKGWFFPLQS